ncbi:MAG: tyrosine-type recombinase/integrase [Candidatus Methanosuratincola verstraetei]|jgi:integrase|uniref:Tyr recombinase domain-containing protein n=1 Tax=Candidatus Methanosuratincola petrocarbonis (ex Vanwonterghem et al. 2016) TaxID=1867261 RepID=A0A7J3UYT5_9CREN
MAKLKLDDVPTWSEVGEFLDRIRALYRKKEISLRDFVLMSLYPTTGMKTSELLSIRKGDIDFQQGVVRVGQEGDKREVLIMPSILPYLKDHAKDKRAEERIFGLTRRQALNINHKYTEMILGRRIRVASWRHAFAIRLLETVRDPSICRKILGQRSSKGVSAYQQILQRSLKEELIKSIGG